MTAPHSDAELMQPRRAQTVLELQGAWLRLEIAQNEIRWAMESMKDGGLNPEAAIEILDDAMGGLIGRPEEVAV